MRGSYSNHAFWLLYMPCRMAKTCILQILFPLAVEKWVGRWILSTFIMDQRIDWMSPVTQSAHVTCTRQKQPQATRVTRRHTDTHTKRKDVCPACTTHTILNIQGKNTDTLEKWLGNFIQQR